MLLNLVLLARTAKCFEDSLARAFPEDDEARENFRMRIENTLFVQLLVGGRLEREGINAKLLSLMALITLAVAPVAVLLYLQIKFLPYHSEWITWLHRGLLAVDLLLVWTLWPGYRRQNGERFWPKKSWWLVPAGALSAVAIAYAVLVATFPDEHMYLATNWLHETDAGALITPVNTLSLLGEDLIDDAKLAHIEEKERSVGAERWEPIFSSAGRDLTGADLNFADVRHVDFSSAILNRAQLISASAEKAVFFMAQLQGASLFGAELRGAMFEGAQLRGASLQRALLQGASLRDAQLQGASLARAQLQGASLKDAQLQRALLNGAQLQGALLNGGQLQDAALDGARLQAASLSEVQLQGASLARAQLQGAWLRDAQLQGTSLDYAQLEGATFVHAYVWRADARGASWQGTGVLSPMTQARESCPAKVDGCEWTLASFERLKHLAESTPEHYRRGQQFVIKDPRLRERVAVLIAQTANINRTEADRLVEELTKGEPAPESVSTPEKLTQDPMLLEQMRLMLEQMIKAVDASTTSKLLNLLAAKEFRERLVAEAERIGREKKIGIEQTLDPTKPLEGEEEMAKVWADHERSSPARDVYEKSSAAQWRKTGCATDGAPFVLRALLRQLEDLNSPFTQDSPEVPKLAAAFLDKDCAGARGLSEDEIAKLKEIAAKAPPPAPKK